MIQPVTNYRHYEVVFSPLCCLVLHVCVHLLSTLGFLEVVPSGSGIWQVLKIC